MRKWLRFAARFYPSSWRTRYGAEFEALLDDSSPAWHDVFDVFRGAIKMQISTWSIRNVIIACGLIGLVIATVWAFSTPRQYASHATLRVTPSQIPENLVPATYNREMADYINRIWQQTSSITSLAEIIQRPDLDLYRSERSRKPLFDVMEHMKRFDLQTDIMGTRPGAKPSSAFIVTFHYPDPVKAQKTTRALIAKMNDVNAREVAGMASVSLDLLDPANLPTKSETNRWPLILAGFGFGLLAGILAVGVRRWPLVAASGVAGFVIVGAASFLIPNLYVSRAMLRANPSQQVPNLMKQILSDEFLEELIKDKSLYASRNGTPIAQLIETMRSRDLKVEILPSNAFFISFRYPDRFVAQQVVSRIQKALLLPPARSDPSGPANVLLVDPPSLPETPAAPNRTTIAWLGMGLGLLGASVARWIRSRRHPDLSPA